MLSEANCEYELNSLLNKKVSGAKDHGKNYIKSTIFCIKFVQSTLSNLTLTSFRVPRLPAFSSSKDYFNTVYIEQTDRGLDFIIWLIT